MNFFSSPFGQRSGNTPCSAAISKNCYDFSLGPDLFFLPQCVDETLSICVKADEAIFSSDNGIDCPATLCRDIEFVQIGGDNSFVGCGYIQPKNIDKLHTDNQVFQMWFFNLEGEVATGKF